jgi:hypothetical protein
MALPPNPGRQGNAYQALGDYVALAQQVSNLLQAIIDLRARESANAYSATYSNTATYALNTDGTPGAQDVSPVHSNPMTGTYLSANFVSGFTGYVVNDLFNFLTGVSGPTVADRRPAIKNMLP